MFATRHALNRLSKRPGSCAPGGKRSSIDNKRLPTFGNARQTQLSGSFSLHTLSEATAPATNTLCRPFCAPTSHASRSCRGHESIWMSVGRARQHLPDPAKKLPSSGRRRYARCRSVPPLLPGGWRSIHRTTANVLRRQTSSTCWSLDTEESRVTAKAMQ